MFVLRQEAVDWMNTHGTEECPAEALDFKRKHCISNLANDRRQIHYQPFHSGYFLLIDYCKYSTDTVLSQFNKNKTFILQLGGLGTNQFDISQFKTFFYF